MREATEGGMRRDLDFMRELLERIEGGERGFTVIDSETADILAVPLDAPVTRDEARRMEEHLKLLEEAGLIEIGLWSPAGFVQVDRLTGPGHDLLAASRDPKMWNAAKAAAQKAGGWTSGVATELVKAWVKSEASKHGLL